MESGSFNSRFDNAQWKLAEHAVWINTSEQGAAHGCPKGQTSRFDGGLLLLVYTAGIGPQPLAACAAYSVDGIGRNGLST